MKCYMGLVLWSNKMVASIVSALQLKIHLPAFRYWFCFPQNRFLVFGSSIPQGFHLQLWRLIVSTLSWTHILFLPISIQSIAKIGWWALLVSLVWGSYLVSSKNGVDWWREMLPRYLMRVLKSTTHCCLLKLTMHTAVVSTLPRRDLESLSCTRCRAPCLNLIRAVHFGNGRPDGVHDTLPCT